jgi:hypothetical protein
VPTAAAPLATSHVTSVMLAGFALLIRLTP